MAGGADCIAFEVAGVHLLSACLTERSYASAARDLKIVLPIHHPGRVSEERAVHASAFAWLAASEVLWRKDERTLACLPG
jgi:hypothetical protein